ncbi:MAG: hypothetical protein J6M08_02100 [Methanobrevibacter sp.]|nr:hypothetical protein [Methanobrevibacter sp.]
MKKDGKCKYCYYNTVLSCSEDPNECEDYEYNHLAEKYENKRYQVKWEDGNDVRVLMTDKLDEFPEWYFETVEDAEELADHLNKKEELIQDIEDDYVNSILDLLDKNLKLKSKQEGLLMGDTYMNKINVLLELLEDTGKEHLVVEFMDKIHDTNPYLIMKGDDS